MIVVKTRVESNPYGHCPGNNYHDVEVRIRERRSGWSVSVAEICGQGENQNDDSRVAVVGFGNDLSDAIADAESRAREAQIDIKLLTQAISVAREEVEDEMDCEAEATK